LIAARKFPLTNGYTFWYYLSLIFLFFISKRAESRGGKSRSGKLWRVGALYGEEQENVCDKRVYIVHGIFAALGVSPV
jgi:hypothetical protein